MTSTIKKTIDKLTEEKCINFFNGIIEKNEFKNPITGRTIDPRKDTYKEIYINCMQLIKDEKIKEQIPKPSNTDIKKYDERELLYKKLKKLIENNNNNCISDNIDYNTVHKHKYKLSVSRGTRTNKSDKILQEIYKEIENGKIKYLVGDQIIINEDDKTSYILTDEERNKFKTDIKFLKNINYEHDIDISLFLSKSNNPHFLKTYSYGICEEPLNKNQKAEFLRIETKYSVPHYYLFYEFVNGKVSELLKDYDKNSNEYKNIIQLSILAILSLHSELYNNNKIIHTNVNFDTLLYRKITPGGYFKYIINGEEFYILNMGFMINLWFFENTILDNKKNYIVDYIDILNKKEILLKAKNNSENELWNYLKTKYFSTEKKDNIVSVTTINIIDNDIINLEKQKFDLNPIQMTIINDKIKPKLIKTLEKIREKIKDRDKLFFDEEHKKMCEKVFKYNKILNKILDAISSEISSDSRSSIKLLKKYKRIKKNLEIERKVLLIKYPRYNHTAYISGEDPFYFTNYAVNLYYNKFSKNFINETSHLIDENKINKFMKKQFDFLQSLSLKEKFLCRDYVASISFFHILKPFEEGTLNFKDLITYLLLAYKRYEKNKIQVPSFHIQLIEVIPELDDYKYEDIYTKKFLEENTTFEEWKEILRLFIDDFNKLFKKAPKTEDELVLYRGTTYEYIKKESFNKFHTLDRFTSCSIDPFIARAYMTHNTTKDTPNILYRITVEKGIPLIFIDALTYKIENMEVLLNRGTKLYIENDLKNTRDMYFHSKKDQICPVDENTNTHEIEIIDLRILQS